MEAEGPPPEKKAETKKIPTETVQVPSKPESEPPSLEIDADRELADLRESWPEIVEKCLVIQPLLRRDLRDSWPLRITERTLTIGFDPEFSGEMEEVNQLDHGGLYHFFSDKLGRPVRMEYEVMKEAVTWSHHSPGEEADAGEETDVATGANGEKTPRDWLRNKTIRQVLEVFHGDIIDIQQ
ncbi:MAG: hypothetical protein WD490_11225 [Opitutales bacterium]